LANHKRTGWVFVPRKNKNLDSIADGFEAVSAVRQWLNSDRSRWQIGRALANAKNNRMRAR